MFAAAVLLLMLAAIGHLILWVSLVNRIHGLGIPTWVIGALTLICWGCLFGIPPALVVLNRGLPQRDGFDGALLAYLLPCALLTLYAAAARAGELLRGDSPAALLSDRTSTVDMVRTLGRRPAGDRRTSWFSRLPGNQVFHLTIHEKTLRIPRLPPALDGLVIAHLSDLHMSGRVDQEYFREIIDLVGDFRPDMVAITGDLFDDPRCVAWGTEILGRLSAPYGVHFVLGNHDQKVDPEQARGLLRQSGLNDLGGRWQRLTLRGCPVVLAGNELPWFGPAADMEHCPAEEPPQRALRILLSHAPDQYRWAQRWDFDLMLAGHTHGGQIRLPLLGPIVAPSRLGTRFASGTFEMGPMVLHVSRGISSFTPLRWNCPPELALLVLRSAAAAEKDEEAAALGVAAATA